MKYLLDTNIVSEVMKKKPDPKVVEWFTALNRIVLCTISLEELFFGLRRRSLLQKEAWLRQMLADKADILPVSDTSAMWSGEKRALLESTGRTVTQADSLIAACAWENGLILATRNVRDFDGFGIPVLNPFE